jgi:hypothetical protein
MHLTDERVAAAELDYLATALQPPCSLGPYALTGDLARSTTALLYTARGGVFGPDTEGVLKLTGSAYAPILQRELALLLEAATAGIDGIIRSLTDDLLWLSVGGESADRPAAALAMPFFSGGDLASLAQRASRTGSLGSALALEAARPLADALRALLTELERPVVHGDVRAHNVLLPTPSAATAELKLIDLDAAHELDGPVLAPSPDAARLLAEDVRGYGEVVALLAGGASSGNRALDRLIAACTTQRLTSMADPGLWHMLADAERARDSQGGNWLGSLLHGWRRR